MDRVFDIYLAKEDQPESDAYAELFLPATPYQMQDAFEKLRLAEGESLYWEVTEYHLFEELSSILNDSCGLNDLNVLAQRLSELDEQQCTAFAGLLKMEQRKGEAIPISRLIDLAYSTECCHVVDEALNDSQLGRFCAESGFFPEAEALPDHVFDLLDFERIGREHRQREGGILVARTADYPGGYVEQRDELLEVYKTLDLMPKVPDYIILAKTYCEGEAKFPFPANTPMGTESVCCVDCTVPSLVGLTGGMETVDLLARRLAGLEPKALTAYKALLDAVDCKDLRSAEQLIDTLDNYIFSPQYSSPIEVAKGELFGILNEEDAATLAPHLNLYQYGQALIQRCGGILTSYGLIKRPDGQPVQSQEIQPGQGGMEMS